MLSPFDITPAAAREGVEQKRLHFKSAAADVRMVERALLGLSLLASILVLYGAFHWTLVVAAALGGALLLAVCKRRNRLERELWWQQVRSGLRDALADTD